MSNTEMNQDRCQPHLFMIQKPIISFGYLRRAVAASLACFLLTAGGSRAGTLYVTSSGSDNLSGASWVDAKQSITNAMAVASAGDQIWVASGVYTQLVTMKAGVALYGGFNGTETALAQRNPSANLSWIHGNW